MNAGDAEPSMIYLDTSVVVALLTPEERSAQALDWFAESREVRWEPAKASCTARAAAHHGAGEIHHIQRSPAGFEVAQPMLEGGGLDPAQASGPRQGGVDLHVGDPMGRHGQGRAHSSGHGA